MCLWITALALSYACNARYDRFLREQCDDSGCAEILDIIRSRKRPLWNRRVVRTPGVAAKQFQTPAHEFFVGRVFDYPPNLRRALLSEVERFEPRRVGLFIFRYAFCGFRRRRSANPRSPVARTVVLPGSGAICTENTVPSLLAPPPLVVP